MGSVSRVTSRRSRLPSPPSAPRFRPSHLPNPLSSLASLGSPWFLHPDGMTQARSYSSPQNGLSPPLLGLITNHHHHNFTTITNLLTSRSIPNPTQPTPKMPSFSTLFRTRSTLSSSSDKDKSSSPPIYSPPTEESLPTYRPAIRRFVLEAEDPMIVHARMLKGHAMGGARHALPKKRT